MNQSSSASFKWTGSPEDYHPGEGLQSLLLKAINIGVEDQRKHQAPAPMLITQIGDEYAVTAFAEMSEGEARRQAARQLSDPASMIVAYAFVFSGILERAVPPDLSVVVVEGAERHMPYAYRLFGIPKDDGSSGAVYGGHGEQLFTA